MIDLDLESQRAAQSITKNCREKDVLENVATKTLGVLQESGVYAAVLYTFTRAEKQKPAAAAIRKGLLDMLQKLGITLEAGPNAATILPTFILPALTESICKDLDRMLLVKQVWEQALIYTRFGAKAEAKPVKPPGNAAQPVREPETQPAKPEKRP
jgi:hypothetical protein